MTALDTLTPESSPPAEAPPSSAFAIGISTLNTDVGGLDAVAAAASQATQAPERSAFDVCHIAVMLRALLFVHGVLALGSAFFVADIGSWLLQFATASGVAVPALLAWLLLACVAQRRLSRLSVSSQWLLALAAGASLALVPWSLLGFLHASPPRPGLEVQGVAVAATGAAMAGAFFHWLRQRARLLQPAATTARLAELQSRIRPHFLFNTLNSAIALVRIDPARAEAVLEDLCELFRAALAEGASQSAATLHEEVELARRYLAIEQIRFGKRLQVRWEIEPATEGALLPPLLLQPLVENAVKHGIEPAALGGMVKIRARVRLGQVEILVANTVPLEASVPGHGMALRNVQERLRLMHDVAANFRAGREGSVYRVRISVPLR